MAHEPSPATAARSPDEVTPALLFPPVAVVDADDAGLMEVVVAGVDVDDVAPVMIAPPGPAHGVNAGYVEKVVMGIPEILAPFALQDETMSGRCYSERMGESVWRVFDKIR